MKNPSYPDDYRTSELLPTTVHLSATELGLMW